MLCVCVLYVYVTTRECTPDLSWLRTVRLPVHIVICIYMIYKQATSKGDTLAQMRGNLAYKANNGIFGQWWVVLASASDVIANEYAYNSLQSCTVNLAQLHHDLSITFTELENRCDCNLIKKLQTAKNSLPDIPVRDYTTSTTVYTSTMYQHPVTKSQNHSLSSRHFPLLDQLVRWRKPDWADG